MDFNVTLAQPVHSYLVVEKFNLNRLIKKEKKMKEKKMGGMPTQELSCLSQVLFKGIVVVSRWSLVTML